MRFAQGRTAVAGGALSLVLAGVGLAACSGDGSDPAPVAAAPSGPAAVVPASVGDGVSASGTVQSTRVRDLGFATGGVITSVKVKVGDKVDKGDLLGTVDPTVAEENLSGAYTAYVAAQNVYEEIKNGGSTAKETKETKQEIAETEVQNGQNAPKGQDGEESQTSGNDQGSPQQGGAQTTAEAYALLVEAKNAHTKAQRELAGTKIHAPFAGTVTAVSGAVDQEVRSGGTVLTLTDAANLRVVAAFSEADTTRLKKGQKAAVTFDSLKETVSGKVRSVSPVPVGTDSAAGGPGGGPQASSAGVVRYEVLVTLNRVPAGTRIGAPVTVEVETGAAETGSP